MDWYFNICMLFFVQEQGELDPKIKCQFVKFFNEKSRRINEFVNFIEVNFSTFEKNVWCELVFL